MKKGPRYFEIKVRTKTEAEKLSFQGAADAAERTLSNWMVVAAREKLKRDARK